MNDIALTALVLGVSFVVWFIWQANNAPEGWEDEEGFHLGKKP